jgi:hypothetical protein
MRNVSMYPAPIVSHKHIGLLLDFTLADSVQA